MNFLQLVYLACVMNIVNLVGLLHIAIVPLFFHKKIIKYLGFHRQHSNSGKAVSTNTERYQHDN